MTALAIDSFSGHVAPGSIRQEWMTNTPYPKQSKRTRSDYYFDEGFYQSEPLATSHPVEEVIKKELRQRVDEMLNRFNQVLPSFPDVNYSVLAEAISRLATLLVNQPFGHITLERTPDASLLVKSTWQDKDVFIDVDFNTDEPAGYDVQVTAYDRNKAVLSVAGSFEFAIGRLLALASEQFDVGRQPHGIILRLSF